MSKKRSALITLLFLAAIFLSVETLTHFRKNEDQRFNTYTNSLFCQEVSNNSISLHYTLKNPSKYGILNVPVSLGNCTTDVDKICASVENTLAALHSYNRNKLSTKNQLTYDVLEDYLISLKKSSKYALYDEPLSPLTGTQAQLPVLLSEYQFFDTSDIETYLKLLEKTPAYFQDILEFEQAKSKAGLFMADYSADDIINECQAFIDMGLENYLYSSFEERLNALSSSIGLTEKEILSYKDKNTAVIQNYVFPAYSSLKEGILRLRGTGKNKNGLCYLPDGNNYYKSIVAGETGSKRSIPELQELTKKQIAQDLHDIQSVLSELPNDAGTSPSSDLFKPQGAILEDSNPSSILTTLENKLTRTFPAPPKVNIQIKYVQKSMEQYLSPAFYMIPAIDNTKNNTIYINQGHIPDDISLFTTLAHEGYPGHLYQTIYYSKQHPSPIRCILNFGGYTEGWATYSEMISYYYAPLSKEQATLMQKNSSILLGLYALADMGIHYEGWTLLDTISFFHSYGILDNETIEDIYDLIISDPANYLKYYIGYVEFLELKKDAIEKWGENFNQKKFHQKILDIGPASFHILRKYMF